MEHEPSPPSDSVFRGDGFYCAVAHYLESEGGQGISELLNEKRFTTKAADVTYRIASHWEDLGLIESRKDRGKGWRKFSLLDLVWLKILVQARAFGFPTEKLLLVRASLFNRTVTAEHSKVPVSVLEVYVALAVSQRKPTYLLIFSDGNAEPVYLEQYNASLKYITLSNHIHLNLNAIIQSFCPHADLSPRYDATVEVDGDELEVLFMLRTGSYDSLTVKRRNGKIETLEAEETITERRIMDLLNEEDYQDVMIKRQDGKTVSIKRKLKRKL